MHRYIGIRELRGKVGPTRFADEKRNVHPPGSVKNPFCACELVLQRNQVQKTGRMSSPTYFQDSNLGGVNLHFSQVYFRNVFKELEKKRWLGGLDNIFP